MSWKTPIDDVQQLAQTIENEYDLQATHRTQELTQKYDLISQAEITHESSSRSLI